MKHLVIRKPTVPEDEGRYFVIKRFNSWQKAWRWIESRESEYYKPGDYIVAQASNWKARGISDVTSPSDD